MIEQKIAAAKKIQKSKTKSNVCSKHHKLGQIETFGLAFIVILISVGFFLFVSFKSRQPVENPQVQYTNDKLSEDFVLSIRDVTIQDCDGFTVYDLIVDCGRDHRITCDSGQINSCTALNDSIKIMLDKTFVVRNTRFRFYSENLFDDNGNTLINVTNLNCTTKSRQGRTGQLVVKLYPYPVIAYLNMNICY